MLIYNEKIEDVFLNPKFIDYVKVKTDREFLMTIKEFTENVVSENDQDTEDLELLMSEVFKNTHGLD